MSEKSGFKLFVKNESDKDRIIRGVIAVILIAFYFLAPDNINNMIATIGLAVGAVLLFNSLSGNCYIYRMLGINTCPMSDSE